jgi:two-component system heavy metal sensor histidine kinase CusS
LLLADLDPAADQLLHAALVNALAEVLALAVIATVLGAWLLTAVTLRPLQRLREAMRRMDRNALDQRLPHQNEDREFAELIGAYNTMLARLEASFLHASRFCADAAHELKTPLTVLQGRLELALNNSATAEAQQRLDLATMQDEVRRLTQIMHRLLLLSQADAGQLPLQREAVDMSGLLEDMMDDVAMLDDARTLTLQIAPNLWVLGDALLLRQLLNNLASNAVRYGHPSGWIRASAWAGAQGLELVLANNTLHPVDAPLRERFFERFYRGTQAHHRHTEGSGLGLELAREIARAHGGELWLQTGTPAAEVWLHLSLPQGTAAGGTPGATASHPAGGSQQQVGGR